MDLKAQNNAIFILQFSSTHGDLAEHCDQAKLRDLLQ